MVKPTPIRSRRKYTQKQKLSAVMAAEIVGVTAAAEQAGIPHQTVSYWLDDPAFGEFRRKAREDMAEEAKVTAHLAWARVAQLAPTMDARDAVFAAEKATEFYQLLSGSATSRTETRELLADFDDHERATVAEWLRSMTKEPVHADG